jgi:hypothetical protein
MSEDETAVVDGFLAFHENYYALRLAETPWWRGTDRKVLRIRLAVIEGMRRGLALGRPVEESEAQRVAEFASRP